MNSVYVLESAKTGRYYIGASGNVSQRLNSHNKGKNKSTRAYRPWRIKYTHNFSTQKEAIHFERYLKSLKKRAAIDKIIIDITAGSSSQV